MSGWVVPKLTRHKLALALTHCNGLRAGRRTDALGTGGGGVGLAADGALGALLTTIHVARRGRSNSCRLKLCQTRHRDCSSLVEERMFYKGELLVVEERTGAAGVEHVAADDGATFKVRAGHKITRARLASCTREVQSNQDAAGGANQLRSQMELDLETLRANGTRPS